MSWDAFFSWRVSPKRVAIVVAALVLPVWGYSTATSYLYGELDGRLTSESKRSLATATFAGGCFWCMEPPFEKLEGVRGVTSGFAGGQTKNPSYDEVASGATSHREAVRVYYVPEIVSYRELLEVYWRQIDPTDAGGQFVDRGKQYTSAIFVKNDRQRKLAEASRRSLENSDVYDEPVVTDIEGLHGFYPARDYHQNYYAKNPIRYHVYRYRSGRDAFLADAWEGHEDLELLTPPESERDGPPADHWQPDSFEPPPRNALRRRLTDIQYRVTQQRETEPPRENRFWDHDEPGIYVDVVSGEPLFSSTHKFHSDSGWPAFRRPLVPDNVLTYRVDGWRGERTELRSRYADSHLGHLFRDGPPPTGHRLCVDSAALEFIPADELHDRGYGSFADTFNRTAHGESRQTNGSGRESERP